MNLSPELLQDVEQIAISQGISAEQFIVQTLREKISWLKAQANGFDAIHSQVAQGTQVVEEDGFLVIDSAPLDHIDFNDLVDQLRTERDQELMNG